MYLRNRFVSKTDFIAHTFSNDSRHCELQSNFHWAQCGNDRKPHQGSHFDECARRNLFEQTDLSYRRGDKKIRICHCEGSPKNLILGIMR